eukprot:jgi/Astpho2/7885/Aster-06369
MADKGSDLLNMSLDDIIKAKLEKKPTGRGRGRGSRQGGEERTDKRLRVTVQDGGMKRKQPRRDRPSGLAFPEDVRVEPPRRTEALEGDAPWDHDAYDEGPRPKRRLALGLGSQRPATNLDDRLDRSSVVSEPGRLEIANLDPNVTEQDIKELFMTVGTLKYSKLMTDSSGASLCKAHVVFHSAADAQTAMSKYNAMTLDGKPMRIRQAEQMQREPGSVLGRVGRPRDDTGGASRIWGQAAASIGIANGGADRAPRGSRAGGLRSSRPARGGSRPARETGRGAGRKDAAQLDRELDDYYGNQMQE